MKSQDKSKSKGDNRAIERTFIGSIGKREEQRKHEKDTHGAHYLTIDLFSRFLQLLSLVIIIFESLK
jgi:hypothetical protein